MAKKIFYGDPHSLKPIPQSNQDSRVFFLDSCTIQSQIDSIEQIVKRGNFRVTHIVLNELKVWKKPWERSKLRVWNRVQTLITLIETKHSDKIRTVNPGYLYNQLTIIEPLLSKSLVYKLIHKQFKLIFPQLQAKTIDLKKLGGLLFKRFNRAIMATFEDELKKLKSKVTLKNLRELRDLITTNMAKTVYKLLNNLNERITETSTMRQTLTEFERIHYNDTNNDKLIVEHFLLSGDLNKHLLSEDKDTFELIQFHRNAVFA